MSLKFLFLPHPCIFAYYKDHSQFYLLSWSRSSVVCKTSTLKTPSDSCSNLHQEEIEATGHAKFSQLFTPCSFVLWLHFFSWISVKMYRPPCFSVASILKIHTAQKIGIELICYGPFFLICLLLSGLSHEFFN